MTSSRLGRLRPPRRVSRRTWALRASVADVVRRLEPGDRVCFQRREPAFEGYPLQSFYALAVVESVEDRGFQFSHTVSSKRMAEWAATSAITKLGLYA